MTETTLENNHSSSPEPALRQTRRWKTAVAAVNVFFGILLGTWPFVTFYGIFAWNRPLETGFHRLLLDYATWTTALYPLGYLAALGFSIFACRREHPRRALAIALLPVLTAYPWVLVLSFFIPVF